MKAALLAGILIFITIAAGQTPSLAPLDGIRPTNLVVPEYPPLARAANVDGDVTVETQISDDGAVLSVEPLSGHPLLREAAIAAARQSKFECPKCGNSKMLVRIHYAFRILGSCGIGEPPGMTTLEVTNKPESTMRPVFYVSSETQRFCEFLARATLKYPHHRSIKCFYLWKCAKTRVHTED